MEQALIDFLAWMGPRALFFAAVLPPLIRISGHWIPEGLFMVAMGVLAANAASTSEAVLLLSVVTLSHFLTDQVVFVVGRWLRPRLGRFEWVQKRLDQVTDRLSGSPAAIWGLVPARVFPSGRVAWLVGSGVAGIPWRRFMLVDIVALLAHLATWSGLGWWVAGDLSRFARSAELGKTAGPWVVVFAVVTLAAFLIVRRRHDLQLSAVATARRAYAAVFEVPRR